MPQVGRARHGENAVGTPVGCRNISNEMLAAVARVQEHLDTSAAPPYDKIKGTGFWRMLTARQAHPAATHSPRVCRPLPAQGFLWCGSSGTMSRALTGCHMHSHAQIDVLSPTPRAPPRPCIHAHRGRQHAHPARQHAHPARQHAHPARQHAHPARQHAHLRASMPAVPRVLHMRMSYVHVARPLTLDRRRVFSW